MSSLSNSAATPPNGDDSANGSCSSNLADPVTQRQNLRNARACSADACHAMSRALCIPCVAFRGSTGQTILNSAKTQSNQ